ncbi:MAG: pentapeptide repeat-containing protein [Cytophagales bacterium]|nr:pentapeptide repeat-containing protein [Cytophagales bacterium]
MSCFLSQIDHILGDAFLKYLPALMTAFAGSVPVFLLWRQVRQQKKNDINQSLRMGLGLLGNKAKSTQVGGILLLEDVFWKEKEYRRQIFYALLQYIQIQAHEAELREDKKVGPSVDVAINVMFRSKRNDKHTMIEKLGLPQVPFRDSYLRHVNFHRCCLKSVHFANCDLERANFTEISREDLPNFQYCKFPKAAFSEEVKGEIEDNENNEGKEDIVYQREKNKQVWRGEVYEMYLMGFYKGVIDCKSNLRFQTDFSWVGGGGFISYTSTTSYFFFLV